MSNDALTETERKIIDAVANSVSVAEAAGKLGVSNQDLYNFFYNLRKKYYKRHRWINVILAQKRRTKLLRIVLTDRAHTPIESSSGDKEYDKPESDEDESEWQQ